MVYMVKYNGQNSSNNLRRRNMPKRGDNIHKRKDGRWEGRYKIGRHSDGRIKYGSVYGKTYRETKEKLAEVASVSSYFVNPKHQITFGEILELWLANNTIRLKGGTITKYRNLIDIHIKPELGNMYINKLNTTIINDYLNKKLINGKKNGSGGLSASYVRSIMIVINSAINFAVNEKYCSPLNSPIFKPIIQKKDLLILTYEEQKKLENAIKNNITPSNIGIMMSLYTGMRIGEICALAWSDIDINKGIIRVRHTIARVNNNNSHLKSANLIIDTPKTRASTRDIPIPSNLMIYLKEIPPMSNYVISDSLSFVKPRTLEYRFHRLLSNANIKSINFHALRHTFATRCIEAGVDVKSLSEILGHANVNITLNTYVHSSIELKRRQLEKIIQ